MPVPEFVTALRAHVGTAPLWLSGVTAVVLDGDQARYLSLVFLCEYVSGQAHAADDESLAVDWFPLDALPQPLAPSSATRIADALAVRADPAAGPRFER